MWHRISAGLVLSGCLLLAPVGDGHGAELAQPAGQVIVTVTGNLELTNRGPFDESADVLFRAHEAVFDRAAVFDLAGLEALGMRTLKVRYPDWPRAYTFEGPLLRDVLAAVGARGEILTAFGLDGDVAEIDMQDLERFPVILALKRDGQYLPLGGHGPAWIIYPRDDYPELESVDETTGISTLYRLDVQ